MFNYGTLYNVNLYHIIQIKKYLYINHSGNISGIDIPVLREKTWPRKPTTVWNDIYHPIVKTALGLTRTLNMIRDKETRLYNVVYIYIYS